MGDTPRHLLANGASHDGESPHKIMTRLGKTRGFGVIVVAALSSVNAFAASKLLPTDILEPRRFLVEAQYVDYSYGGKWQTSGIIGEADAAVQSRQMLTTLGFGLLSNVDVRVQVPYVLVEQSEIEGDTSQGKAVIKGSREGVGDTQLQLRLGLTNEAKSGVNAVLGLIGIFPTGRSESGQPEIILNGSRLQTIEYSRPGEGVLSYGGGLALSAGFGDFKPYLVGSYVIGGQGIHNGVRENYSDDATSVLGVNYRATERATLGVCLLGISAGPEIREERGRRVREERALAGGVGVAMQIELFSDATFILGITHLTMAGHVTDLDGNTKAGRITSTAPNIGFQLLF